MRDWIDVTRPIDDSLLLWPGRSGPTRRWDKRIADGHHCNVSEWRIDAHTGTHMDAPRHFFDDGRAIDEIAPDTFAGECVLIDLPADAPLTVDAARALAGVGRLLIRTAHSRAVGPAPYPAHDALLTDEAASLLAAGGLLLIGTDRLSVNDSEGRSYDIHRRLLGAGCAIVEGLALADVATGRYDLIAAPLRYTGAEASPCRALLRCIAVTR